MNRSDRLIRASAAATVVAIGAIAAVISYRHALGVAQAHGESGVNAYLTPLTIDGLVFVASMVLLDSARRRTPAPVLARLALALGLGEPWPLPEVGRPAPVATGVLAEGPQIGEGTHDASTPAVAWEEPAVATARERFADVLAAGSVPSVRAIRRELRVGHPRAVRIHAALAGSA